MEVSKTRRAEQTKTKETEYEQHESMGRKLKYQRIERQIMLAHCFHLKPCHTHTIRTSANVAVGFLKLVIPVETHFAERSESSLPSMSA